jgi:WD40 repeat protein
MWDAYTGEEIAILPHDRYVNKVAWSPDGNFLLTLSRPIFLDNSDYYGFSSVVQMWDAHNGEKLFAKRVQNTSSWNFDALWSSDASRILIWMPSEILVWDIQEDTQLLSLPHSELYGATWNMAETRILSWGNGKMKIWEVATGNELVTIGDFNYENAEWSPDERHILSWSYTGESNIRVWDADSGEETLVIEAPCHKVEFVPNGDRIVAFRESIVQVFDAFTGEVLVTLDTGYSSDAAWCPDGILSKDGTLIILSCFHNTEWSIWDTITGDKTFIFPYESALLYDIAWSPNETHVVTISEASRDWITVWDLSDLAEHRCANQLQ